MNSHSRTGLVLTLILFAAPIAAVAAITLTAPASAPAGSELEVTWSGGDSDKNLVTIVEKGAPEGKYSDYKYARSAKATLSVPEKPGEYEIRYLEGQQPYATLARQTLVVEPVTATLDAPDEVKAGAEFAVTWSGPANRQDFVSLAAAGTDQRSYVGYRYTRDGPSLNLRAPDEPGEYEIRYQTGQAYAVLASRPLVVKAANATVSGPAEVEGGAVFEVEWSGPDNRGDYIGIISADAQPNERHAHWAYTREGSPLSINARLAAGKYELRYETGQKGIVLARAALSVAPSSQKPGSLRVVSEAKLFAKEDGVEIILDASGSMLQRHGERRRIEIAREVLLGLTGEVVPPGTAFALRVFGHREADSCRTDLEIPVGPLDVSAVESRIAGIQAMNLAKTPIAASLALAKEDMRPITGMSTIILITDGEETCGGDPAATIQTLRDSGMNVRIDIVGFAIDDEALKTSFRYWADLGGGSFYDAADAESLAASITQALHAPFDIYNADKAIVASGTVGGEPVDLTPGEYSVRVRGRNKVESGVQIEPEQEQILELE